MGGVSSRYWEIVAGCWVVFWAYWTVVGLRVRAPTRKAGLAFTIPNTLLLYAGFVLVLMGRTQSALFGPRVTSGEGIEITGTMLVVMGIAIAIWSRWTLGSHWSATVRIGDGQRLIRSGPYARVAHPIYSGIGLAVLGSALVGGMLGNLLGFVLVVVSFWYKARLEERFLLAAFGDDYARYRQNVNFMVPFLW